MLIHKIIKDKLNNKRKKVKCQVEEGAKTIVKKILKSKRRNAKKE